MLENTKIYQFDKTTLLASGVDDTYLSADEQERAKQFIFPADQQWFTICRAKLRSILAAELGCAEASLTFTYNDAGKPQSSLIKFNVSHTKERLIIATHPTCEVGVDIEQYQDKDNTDIIKRFFHPEEVSVCMKLPIAQRKQIFYQLWVIKEAIAKALGISLYQVMGDLSVSGFVDGIDIKIQGELKDKLQIQLLPFEHNHYGAIAICALSHHNMSTS